MIGNDLILKVENVSKVYRLGEIGGTTLRDELQRVWAKIRRKDDPTKIIGAKNFNKGEKFKALDNISFEVKRGERIGIIGHNGAGKSTLLKLISRVTGPTSGQILLNGRVASMLEVGTGFHPELTGRENIYMNGAILGMTKKEIDTKIEDIIDFSEVRQFIDTPVKRYSSGMYVKLAFAVASHLNSEIVIMDEVLAVGDVTFQNKCIQKMKAISLDSGRTILYVSHNMNTIRQLCDKVLVMNEGRVEFFGDVEEGISHYVKSVFINGNVFDISNKRSSYLPNKIEAKAIKISLIDKENPIYLFNEPISFLLKFKLYKKISKLGIRFEIKTAENMPIGMSTAFIEERYSKDTEYEISISLPLKGVVEGTYLVGLVLFEINEQKHSCDLDCVSSAFSFKVISTDAALEKWNKTKWGNILFDTFDAKIVRK